MIKTYKYDNYLIDSASDMQEQQFRKQTHKSSTSSTHPHEQYSTASSSDSDEENNQNSNQNQQQIGQQQNDSSNNQTQKDRYKTELCRNFQLFGTCNYGKKCQYAHGRHELQQKPERKTNQYYKTRPCKEFFNTLACPYGQRCKYNHDIRPLSELFKPNTFYQKKLQLMSAPEQETQQKSNNSANRLEFFSKNFNSSVPQNNNLIQTTTSPSTFSAEKKENYFFQKSIQKEINIGQIPMSAYMIFNESTPSLTLQNSQNFNQKTFQPTMNQNILSSNYFFSW